MSSSDGQFRGFVDLVDLKLGIAGWVVDLATPDRPVQIELWAGPYRAARIHADLPRSDVSIPGGIAPTPGFRFGREHMLELQELAVSSPEAEIRVKIAGTNLEIGAAKSLPKLASFLKQAELSDAKAGQTNLLRIMADDLGKGLALMRRAAEQRVRRPLPVRAEAFAGYIEAVSTETAGLLWFFGWKRGGSGFAHPGVLVDKAKFPSSIAYATFPRTDLPDDAVGIVGVMLTDWRPEDPDDVALLHFGEDAANHLRTQAPLRSINAQDWAARFKELRPLLQGPLVPALQRLLGASSLWLPGNAPLLGLSVDVGVDKFLALPGFGALVEGWILSPAQKPQGLMLRLGERVLHADPTSIFYKPRPDLASVMPNAGRLVDEAGFVAVFRGAVTAEDLARPILKVIFSQGVSTNHELDGRTLRLLGHAEGFASVLSLYPDPSSEGFFPAMVDAVSSGLRPRLRELSPIDVMPTRNALVLAMADDRSEIMLGFASLMEAMRRELLPGVAILAQPGPNRALTLSLFRAMADRYSLPCSLFFLPDVENAPYIIPQVLSQIGADRVAFIGPGLHPDMTAMQYIGKILKQDPVMYGAGLPIRSNTEAGGAAGPVLASAEAFVMESSQALDFLNDLPPRIGGLASRQLQLPLPVLVGNGSVSRTWERELDRFSTMINVKLSAEAAQ